MISKSTLLVALTLSIGGAVAQPAPIINVRELQNMMADKSHDIHIVNFWATWCGPCIKELPQFEKVSEQGDPEVKVTLVSLDLDLDPDAEKVYRFIRKRGLTSDVVLLKTDDPNSWIDKVEARWSGALPSTIIIDNRTGERKFIGRALHEGELDQYLNTKP